MLNFDKKDAHVYPFDESPGAGIIMDVDLEQLICESERLRVCKAIFASTSIENWHLRDALEAVLTEPNTSSAGDDIPAPVVPPQAVPPQAVPPQEADHA